MTKPDSTGHLLHRRAAVSRITEPDHSTWKPRPQTIETTWAWWWRTSRPSGCFINPPPPFLGAEVGPWRRGRTATDQPPLHLVRGDKDTRAQRVIVVQDQDHPLLLSDAFECARTKNWLTSGRGRRMDQTIACAVRRARSAERSPLHRGSVCLSGRRRRSGTGDGNVERPLRGAVKPADNTPFFTAEPVCLGEESRATIQFKHWARKPEE